MPRTLTRELRASLHLLRSSWLLACVLLLAAATALAACGGDDEEPAAAEAPAAPEAAEPAGPSDQLIADVIENYADGVHATYVTSLDSAQILDDAIDVFVENPTPATLEAAKRAWLEARDDYGVTEAYRFYGGPIDNEEDGPEGLINAWPLDEAYIDYVEGDPNAGIVNNPGEFPEITADLIVSLNEVGGEANVSTGWHAIEFLLWGQDLNADGPGDRPLEDYTTNANADRRATYLATASDVLIGHLQWLVDAWDPRGSGNYYAAFLALDANEALTNIITGIGELSRGELAGERMTVAYEERAQEDEHSCFADNTTNDIIANALGIQNVWLGDFGTVRGPGIVDLVAATDQALADRLTEEIAVSVANATSIPAPFDAHLLADLPDSSPGRRAVLKTIESLEDQTDTIVAAGQLIGVTVSVS